MRSECNRFGVDLASQEGNARFKNTQINENPNNKNLHSFGLMSGEFDEQNEELSGANFKAISIIVRYESYARYVGQFLWMSIGCRTLRTDHGRRLFFTNEEAQQENERPCWMKMSVRNSEILNG